jgi:hypothetical protein
MERGYWGGWNPWAGAPGNDRISIAQLVWNHTLSAEMAATLWLAMDRQASFLCVAMPRGAGKTTLAGAILALRQPDVNLHFVYGEAAEMDALRQAQLGGYIVVGEISHAPMPSYIWGTPVQRVFETAASGYSLQTSLHARSVEEAIGVVTRGNAISDAHASTFDLVLYIEAYQTNRGQIARRLVDLFEVDRVENGLPVGRSLYRWDIDTDAWEQTAEPQTIGPTTDLAARTALIAGLAETETNGPAEVAEALAKYRAGL